MMALNDYSMLKLMRFHQAELLKEAEMRRLLHLANGFRKTNMAPNISANKKEEEKNGK